VLVAARASAALLATLMALALGGDDPGDTLLLLHGALGQPRAGFFQIRLGIGMLCRQ